MPTMCRRRTSALVMLLAVLAATALTAVPASAGGGGCHAPATEGRGTTLALRAMCFSPTVLRVAAGSEVTIVNRDGLAHPLARPGGEWFWDGAAGGTTTVRLDRDGTYPFFCYAHPGMVGVVVAGDGRGTGSAVAEVVDSGPGAGPELAAGAAGSAPAPASSGPGAVPTAWLVLVALCALVGAAAGTRLAAGRSGR